MSRQYDNLICDIIEGDDGLYAVRVTDTSTNAIWWHTVCETSEDAVKSVESLFETEAIKALQKQMDYVNLKSR